ncbi:decapping and exoribonuclease protein-like [Daphnia pulicaria]|uniref:decapping and exoribonuclease protein-like n=1 Tax=Daphnia pulicaria TaxID=35523 RepID=UPI001EEBB99E|nr:decapping and exoribonuclease protein-like [Daphnia pulicaria]
MKRQYIDMKNGSIRDPRFRNNNNEKLRKNLSLIDIEEFDGNFPEFTRPKNVGSFSLDIHRNYVNDYSELRYLSMPPEASTSGSCKVNFDLKRGVSRVVEKDEESIRQKMLDDLLRWILQERKAEHKNIIDHQHPLRPLLVEFVCYRGLLTLLIATPYECQENWTILATRFQNSIYLWQLKESKKQNGSIAVQKEKSIWGFKFEQYLCASSPNGNPNPNEQVNTNAEFCCVLKTRIGGLPLLYGAEVDAVTKESQPPFLDLQNFVELKTNKHIGNEMQQAAFNRFKSMKWWAQSFIVGIPKIVVGYRDDDGVVSRLETMDVNQLRKQSTDCWKSNICMNFCLKFLKFVKECIPKDSTSNDHFLFEFDAMSRVISFRNELGETRSRNLLPSWYVESMQKSA